MNNAPIEAEVVNVRQAGPLALPRESPIVVMAHQYHIEPGKLLEVLRNTVIKATNKHTPTNEEVAAFIIVANQYGLNPFTREIHAFYSEKSGVVPIVGVDGWVKLVNRTGLFNGCDFEEIVDREGRLIGMTCVMYIKGREHPVRAPEYLAECRRETIPWRNMPRRMLRHKAYTQAARLAFGFSGIHDEDEGRDIIGSTPAAAPAKQLRQVRQQAWTDEAEARREPPAGPPADGPARSEHESPDTEVGNGPEKDFEGDSQ